MNAKISQKGGQLIYELDVSQRELRVLRDNYRLMKKMMLEDLKHEYMKSIQDRDNKIGQLRNQYKEHRERVTAETIVAVSDNFKKLEDEVDKKRRDIDNINNGMGGSAVANLKRANDETNKHN